ncbi:DPY30 domain-containing protein 1 isoform X1 [Tursiops truncatus]|uniref:DPY30 domain-containing protein 1 isoform X1 n=1 Tax=Tursiops truncatus TaxID=9739 RepID=UPI003CCFCF31
MESAYLQKNLGTCLTQGLAEVARMRPVDPIEYLALWIYNYKNNVTMEQQRQEEMAQLEQERELAVMEQEMMERLKAEEFLFQQQQLAFQLELEMQEKERQRIEELQRAQEQLEKELRMNMESIAKGEDISHGEDEADSGRTLAEISDRYGAPNLSRVEELDEPMLSDASHCCGLSRCGVQALDAQAQRPWLTGPAAPWHVGSSRTGARTRVPCIDRRTLNRCTTREAPTLKFLSK